MKDWMRLVSLLCLLGLLGAPVALAADKPEGKAKKLTCCEEAIAKGQECKHRCCITAHRKSETCQKCNPNKEDLKALKKRAEEKAKGQKAEVRGQKSGGKGQKEAEQDQTPGSPSPKSGQKPEKS